MFAQLGNIVFKGLNGFTGLGFTGGEAKFAEISLINSKSLLQHVGFGLNEINVEILLEASFCNPSSQLKALLRFRDDAAILPFLLGNGDLLGQMVITNCSREIITAFSDGTPKSIQVSLSLKEYFDVDPLEQKKLEANAKAFALNTTHNISLPIIKEPNLKVDLAKNITETKSISASISNEVAVLKPHDTLTADKIIHQAKKGAVSINTLINRIEGNINEFANHPNIKSAAVLMLGNFQDIITAYPLNDIAHVIGINDTLQANTRSLSTASTSIFQEIIIRK